MLVSGFNIISGKLKALQPNSQELQAAKYGKVPRSVGIANNVSCKDFVCKKHFLCALIRKENKISLLMANQLELVLWHLPGNSNPKN